MLLMQFILVLIYFESFAEPILSKSLLIIDGKELFGLLIICLSCS